MGVETKRVTASPPDGEGAPVTLIERAVNEDKDVAYTVRHGGRTVLATNDAKAAVDAFDALAVAVGAEVPKKKAAAKK